MVIPRRATCAALVAALTAACAPPERPDNPAAAEYQIPVIKSDGRVQRFTVEPEPGETERMLFCVESPDLVLCLAEEGGVAQRYFFPLVRPDPMVGERR